MNSSRLAMVLVADARSYRLALPFTLVPASGALHFVAGEDFRYSVPGPEIDVWGPGFFELFSTAGALDASLEALDVRHRPAALSVFRALIAERVLVEAPPEQAPESVTGCAEVHGDCSLAARLRRLLPAAQRSVEPESAARNTSQRIHVFCQDTLDEGAALRFNGQRLEDGSPWLWVSTGAQTRAYVSPLFLPWRGPCFGCLMAAFDRVSTAPQLRKALRDHVQRGELEAKALVLAPIVNTVLQLVSWKLGSSEQAEVPPAVYQLHVLETGSFQIAVHSVPVDVDCSAQCAVR